MKTTNNFAQFWELENRPGEEIAQARHVAREAMKAAATAAYHAEDYKRWAETSTELAACQEIVDQAIRRVAFAAWLDQAIARCHAEMANKEKHRPSADIEERLSSLALGLDAVRRHYQGLAAEVQTIQLRIRQHLLYHQHNAKAKKENCRQ